MQIVIYSKNSCVYCTKAKNLVKNLGLDYTEKKLEEFESVEKMLEDIGKKVKTMPQIKIDGELIGGYHQLVEYFDDKGLVNFDLYDFQADMVNKFHENRFNIAKLPRQSGKSTIVTAYLLWYVLFNDNVNVAILANKAPTAREMLGRLQLSYENLPKWMQKGGMCAPKGPNVDPKEVPT